MGKDKEVSITLICDGTPYFLSHEEWTDQQWEDHFRKLAERTLAHNGWRLSKIEVRS